MTTIEYDCLCRIVEAAFEHYPQTEEIEDAIDYLDGILTLAYRELYCYESN